MGRLPEGTLVVVIDAPVTLNDVTWYHIVSVTTRLEDWVSGEYLEPGPVPAPEQLP